MNLQSLNLLAIIVSGLVYFFLGALWYSPMLFAKSFIKYRGMTAEQIQSQGGQPLDYLFTLIAEVLTAFVLAIFVQVAGATTLLDGVAVGLIAALGFAATTSFVYTIFSARTKCSGFSTPATRLLPSSSWAPSSPSGANTFRPQL